jgi:hypothetical protein
MTLPAAAGDPADRDRRHLAGCRTRRCSTVGVNETPSGGGDDPAAIARRQRIAAVGPEGARGAAAQPRRAADVEVPARAALGSDGASVIVTATAVVAIITAAITSAFVARAEREHALADGVEDAALEARLNARFDPLESMLHEEKT